MYSIHVDALNTYWCIQYTLMHSIDIDVFQRRIGPATLTLYMHPSRYVLVARIPWIRACVAVCCSMLQCVAVCCSVMQCVWVHRVNVAYIPRICKRCAVCCSALQCVAVRCSGSALQCVAVRCSALQCVAVRCSALQHVVVCRVKVAFRNPSQRDGTVIACLPHFEMHKSCNENSEMDCKTCVRSRSRHPPLPSSVTHEFPWMPHLDFCRSYLILVRTWPVCKHRVRHARIGLWEPPMPIL